jgi:[1-hydroxy-2-(trimethylamino)ethyl]phosphonate dioxygenase
MSVVTDIIRLFETKGDAAYHGEPVSQTEHALQTAHLAEKEGAADAVVVAALLHDIGHLLSGHAEDVAERGIDTRHEAAGERWLSRHFGLEITEPIRLHVAAKRYACGRDPDYLALLSPASVRSLELQGGPMTALELAEFEKSRYFREALQLRRFDDLAKVPRLDVPGLEHYRARLEAAARRKSPLAGGGVNRE